MSVYPFNLVPPRAGEPLEDTSCLTQRPFVTQRRSLKDDAKYFVAGDRLADAINTAIAVGDPLLLTGEPGTGKTQAGYYTAFQLGVECIHFQVKSDSTAHDLLYHFDMVRYFRDAHLQQQREQPCPDLDKHQYLEQRPLWRAFDLAEKHGAPQVLLIDEIDKAPRDFPNDLLHELDQMEFTIIETGDIVKTPPALRPILVITSNSERRLPEPFLRRCVYHHIEFSDDIARQALESRRQEFGALSDEFLELALSRFLTLRERHLRKIPSTSEFLMWLRVLSMTVNKHLEHLDDDLSQLPSLSALLKDHQDIAELRSGRI